MIYHDLFSGVDSRLCRIIACFLSWAVPGRTALCMKPWILMLMDCHVSWNSLRFHQHESGLLGPSKRDCSTLHVMITCLNNVKECILQAHFLGHIRAHQFCQNCMVRKNPEDPSNMTVVVQTIFLTLSCRFSIKLVVFHSITMFVDLIMVALPLRSIESHWHMTAAGCLRHSTGRLVRCSGGWSSQGLSGADDVLSIS